MMTLWERWEYFPTSISPFAYNETVAQDYFPLSQSEISTKGRKWEEREDKHFDWSVYKPWSIDKYDEIKIGKEIADRHCNDILNGILQCETTHKPFKLTKSELIFYIKNHLSIPTKCPDQRHLERIALRNPRQLRDRQCMKCWIEIKTSYNPERQEIVYCENCYNKEIYG
jgi:hypothetical protein